MGEYISTCLDIIFGVLQGSVLGPKLLILYINDICMVSRKLKIVLFIDDTTVRGKSTAAFGGGQDRNE